MAILNRGDRLVVATHNPGKLREINELLAPFGCNAVSAGSLGLPEPEETEATFIGNAEIKSLAAMRGSGLAALSDDSGIEVHALGGEPGVYSANWAGPGKDFAPAIQKVLDRLAAAGAKTPGQRRANFTSVLSLAIPGRAPLNFEGKVFGTIVEAPRGNHGFGYDPIFQPDGFDITFGEMQPAEKHKVSHRAVAFAKFIDGCLT